MQKLIASEVRAPDSDYCLGKQQLVYHALHVDAALAAERQANTELAIRERKAEAELADANHALLLANSNAAAFQRVAEQRQGEIERYKRAVEWITTCGAIKIVDGGTYFYGNTAAGNVPAELAEIIIKPTTGASNEP